MKRTDNLNQQATLSETEQRGEFANSVKKHRGVFTIIALVVSVLFIMFGIFRSETKTIFNKAIRICTECVGLG